MNNKKKGEYIGLLGTVLIHVALVILLLWLTVKKPIPQEGGLAVAIGMEEQAFGMDDPGKLVDVDVIPAVEETPSEPEIPESLDEPEMITQEEEPTVVIPSKKKPEAKPKPKPKPKPAQKPELTPEQKAAEAKRKAAEEAERKRKAAAAAASKNVANAFGKGSGMNKGNSASGKGIQGSKDGNQSTGASSGIGTGASFSLDGRSLGTGSLPLPVYNVQEEGRVVVNITVNPAGTVINVDINRRLTNVSSPALRKAAIDAAKKTRFNEIEGVKNQMGTITYVFELK